VHWLFCDFCENCRSSGRCLRFLPRPHRWGRDRAMGMLRHAKHPTPKETILIASWGVFLALDLALWNTSLLLTFAARATLLANNALLWTKRPIISVLQVLPGTSTFELRACSATGINRITVWMARNTHHGRTLLGGALARVFELRLEAARPAGAAVLRSSF